MTSLSVLIYGYNYAPEPTGIGRFTAGMADWLAARGHSVTVITAPPHYPAWTVAREYRGRGFHAERIGDVTVLRTPVALPGGSKGGLLTRLALETSFNVGSARWWLSPHVRGPFDIVIAVCPPLQAALWPWWYRRWRGVPWVLHVQDLQFDAAIRLGLVPGPPWLHEGLYRAERVLLRGADRVSTISERMRDALIAKGLDGERVWVARNWSDPAAFDVEPHDGARMRTVLGADHDDVLVVYAGNMGEKQGLDVVLDAAERLRAHPRLRFALVGAGVARDALERQARGRDLVRMTFLDPVADRELPELLAAADIHLVVQRASAADLVMPSKLANILAAGQASISTASPGTELYRVVAGERVGRTVPPEDPSALARAILDLASDPSARLELGVRARSFARAHLQRDAILMGFERRLASLVRRDRRFREA